MTEFPQALNPENRNPKPAILDIVKVDGRWAQVKGGGGAISFLDNGQQTLINWNEYNLVKSFGSIAVSSVMERFGEKFTDEEIKSIHWQDTEHDPKLKLQVRVFGEYSSKK